MWETNIAQSGRCEVAPRKFTPSLGSLGAEENALYRTLCDYFISSTIAVIAETLCYSRIPQLFYNLHSHDEFVHVCEMKSDLSYFDGDSQAERLCRERCRNAFSNEFHTKTSSTMPQKESCSSHTVLALIPDTPSVSSRDQSVRLSIIWYLYVVIVFTSVLWE